MAIHKDNPGPRTKTGKRAKVRKVLGEFKRGELQSSTGAKVTKRKQAVAIALSEAGLARPKRQSHNPHRIPVPGIPPGGSHGVTDLVEPLPILNAQLGHDHDAQRLMENLRRGPTS